MVNTRQFSGSTYMQDMTKSHKFSAKNQGSTLRRFDLYAEKYGSYCVFITTLTVFYCWR